MSAENSGSGDLWIFGYGSLIWKQNFEFEEAVPSYIRGYKRVFFQGSTDHRGVPGSPGRVVTLLPVFDFEEDNLQGNQLKLGKDESSIVHGVSFRIAKDKIDEVLKALDIREQGGYDREFLTTYIHRVAAPPSDSDKSVLPFFLQKNLHNTEEHKEGSVLCDKTLCYIANEENDEYLGPGESPAAVANQIFHSVGPSGPNTEYLIKLCQGIRALNAPDDHCFELEKLVLEIARRKNNDKSVEME